MIHQQIDVKLLVALFYAILIINNNSIAQCTPNITGIQPGIDLGIEGVELNDLSFFSALEEGYVDYTSETANLSLGGTYTLELTVQYFDQYFFAWIDWNQDNVFDSSEQIMFLDANGGGITFQEFQVPYTALTGATKMRVLADDLTNPIPTACDQTTGDVEDYTVVISEQAMQINTIFDLTFSTGYILKGENNRAVHAIRVNTYYTLTPNNITKFYFSTSGTSDLSILNNAKLWYTAEDYLFDTTLQFGNTVSISTQFEISGNIDLQPEENFFWLTFDISNLASFGDTIVVRCDSIVVDGAIKYPTYNPKFHSYNIVNQKEDFGKRNIYNKWLFGSLVGLDMNGSIPVATAQTRLNSVEGATSICDVNGELLFYTDGETVWTKNHSAMPNGTGLLGHYSSKQSAIITPYLQNPNRYYIFTTDGHSTGRFTGLNYSVVDMTLNDGFGDVVSGLKNINLTDSTTEKVTAAIHSNGLWYWIITQKTYSNEYHAYLVTCDEIIDTPVISIIGTNGHIGFLRSSADGKSILSENVQSSPMAPPWTGNIQLFDFNNTTGELTYNIELNKSYGGAAISFSPNDSFIYINYIDTINVFPLAVFDRFASDIISSKMIIDSNYRISSMQVSPDKNIYFISNTLNYIHRITNPNDPSNVFIEDSLIKLLGFGNAAVSFNETFYSLPWTIDKSNYIVKINDTTICIGDSIYIGRDSISGLNYNWQPNVNNPTVSNPLVFPITSTNYTVQVTDNECIYFEDTVIINLAMRQFDLGNDTSICNGSSFTLKANSGVAYEWSNGEIDSFIIVDSQGLYRLNLTDQYNCQWQDSIYISMRKDIFIPNSFTPNNDGINDILTIEGLSEKSQVSIYDRWGKLQFQTDQSSWNGKIKNQIVPGNYIYILETTCASSKILQQGNIYISY